MLHEISYQIINLHVYAISGQNRASEIPVTLAAQGMVWLGCEFWRTLKIC
jgi:hypothetical protein